MTAAAVACSTPGAPLTESQAIKRARLGGIEVYLRAALARAPQTTRQLHDAAPDVPYQFVRWCGQRGCRGHVDAIAWYRMRGTDMQRILVRWEKQGRAQRVVIAGWQSHLWALAPDGPS